MELHRDPLARLVRCRLFVPGARQPDLHRRLLYDEQAAHDSRFVLCGRNAVQISERSTPVDLKALAAQMAPVGDVKVNEFLVRAHIAGFEFTVFPDGRAIIKGTSDPGVARSLYAKYVGM